MVHTPMIRKASEANPTLARLAKECEAIR